MLRIFSQKPLTKPGARAKQGETMYTGSCLCGEVSFHITGKIENIIYCHCSKCRKAQGSAFATNGNVNIKNFELISGKNSLTRYESSKGQFKYFCKICGSPIMSKNASNTNNIRVRLGSIETDIREKPEAHIFVSSKANWEEIDGNLPRYDSYEQTNTQGPGK